jgi:hypothetical protein
MAAAIGCGATATDGLADESAGEAVGAVALESDFAVLSP